MRVRLAFFAFGGPANRVLKHFYEGARACGHPVRWEAGTYLREDETAVFFGARLWSLRHQGRWAKEGRLIQIDNSWWNNERGGSWRMAWNGIQPHPDCLALKPRRGFSLAPVRARRGGNGVLALQSDKLFDILDIGCSRDVWIRNVSNWMKSLGYSVTVREKPRGKLRGDFISDLADMDYVVSLSSTSSLIAVMNGVPAICLSECALSPSCNHVVKAGEVWERDDARVSEHVARLDAFSFSAGEVRSGLAWREFLSIAPEYRRGLSPGGIP